MADLRRVPQGLQRAVRPQRAAGGAGGVVLLGTLNILLNRRKRLGFTGIAASGLAVFLGGTNIQFETIGQTPIPWGWTGSCWRCWSRPSCSSRWRSSTPGPAAEHPAPHWRTDLAYFFVSHMLVQFILIFVTASSTLLGAGRCRRRRACSRCRSGCSSSSRCWWRTWASTGCTACTTWCPGCGASMRCTTRARRWTGWPARASTSWRSC